MEVPGITGATQVSAGVAHTCAVAGGEVSCWGDDEDGALGDGNTEPQPLPVAVGITGATAVSAGVRHTCALVGTGDVMCWGGNDRGQVGNGTTDPALTPQMVIVGDPVVSIATGSLHSCAAFMDGRVACWGANGAGQLGLDTMGMDAALPQAVTGISNAVEVVAGRNHTCARLGDGSVSCWGGNGHGQVGNGTMTQMPTPTPVMLSGSVTAIGTGPSASHSCAVTDSGASCWGANATGQLGDGMTMDVPMPTPMTLLETMPSQVRTGGASTGAMTPGFTCVLQTTGAVQCIGDGGLGQLGQGQFVSSTDALVDVGLRL